MTVLAMVLAGVILGLCMGAYKLIVDDPVGDGAAWLPLVLTLVFGYLAYLMAGPYLQVRIGNLAWSATTFSGVSISSHLKARAYMKLQLGNSILTLLSLGLYRPFAVVRAYRYRLDHITVTTEDGLERALAGVALSGSASADGVADFLGVDLSW